MLTVKQFAAKIGCSKSSVQRWITSNLIPGVEVAKFNEHQTQYMIPDDAVRPKIDTVIVDRPQKRFVPDTSGLTDDNHKKQLEFVKNHPSLSVRSIAQKLGVPTSKVRELFDELLRMNNPCNPITCKAYALGYCEYDFATGQIMPIDEENCPLLKKEEK